MSPRPFRSFAEFWPFYLSQHCHPVNRRLHFFGMLLALSLLALAFLLHHWWIAALAPVAGYGFSWVGHFFLEKNRPATFTYPVYSFLGDLKMLSLMLRGQKWQRP